MNNAINHPQKSMVYTDPELRIRSISASRINPKMKYFEWSTVPDKVYK
ncbi:MAG: hypothetical protein LBR15_05885 [Methanobrevibacter sp.]|jgi:hypothetical protein|nr:hypothetical protein [Candidatus Methanovirga australis]